MDERWGLGLYLVDGRMDGRQAGLWTADQGIKAGLLGLLRYSTCLPALPASPAYSSSTLGS